jgi:hypothetical protein
VKRFLEILTAILIIGTVWVGGSDALEAAPLAPGEKIDLSIPASLKGMGTSEGYFYTPGEVTVVGYNPPCVVTIRDPAAPDPPVAIGAIESTNPAYQTTLPAGFYFISVTSEAGVLVGVSNTATCNGYYHYRSTGEPYGNTAMASKFYIRGTGGCDNRMLIFSPQGNSMGGSCCDILCLDFCGINFELFNSNQFYDWSPGDLFGVLGVNSGAPVQVLARDDQGYFVPPFSDEASDSSNFWTYHGENEYLNIHSFVDGTTYEIINLHSDFFGVIESGSLENGETFSYLGTSNFNNRVLKVRTTKGQASVSVLGGLNPEDNTNYMSYVLDQNGNFQGTDFITRSHTGGFIYVTGLQDDTAVEVREASTEALQSAQSIDAAHLANVNPGSGTWRIRSDKEITVAVGHGNGGTFIPLTQNTTGTTPYPPVIAGVRWSPYFPRTSDASIDVTFLTDEMCTSKLNYKIGTGAWQQTAEGPLGTEHSHSIPLTGLTSFTPIRFRPEARDQSGSVTVDNNGGNDYVVFVREDAPNLEVSIDSAISNNPVRTIRFLIHNAGAGEAFNVELHPRVQGFQPLNEGVTANYNNIKDNYMFATLPVPNIQPGGTTFVDLNLMPYLSEKGNVNYNMLSCSVSAFDTFGHLYTKDPFELFYDFDDGPIESEMAGTRYVVLANLKRFFENNPTGSASAQKMPREMAAFTLARGGVLAYTSSDDEEKIRSYIHGRFNGKINKSWLNAGYLLLVGSSNVMPSFHVALDCPFADEVQIGVSDNVYANVDDDDDYTPELIIGRITGAHPDTYSALFQRAQTPNYFDKALAISGTGDGDSEFFSNAKECNELLDQHYTEAYLYRLRNFDPGDRPNVYTFNSNNTDFFYYRDHGYVGGWDSFGRSSVSSISFGSKYPIIYSNACLTGQVQSDNNLAEEFLAQSASVFLGATQVSPRSANNALGKKIVNYHKQGQSIGQAFRNGKRSLAGDLDWYSLCWSELTNGEEILMYNLYGDPFRGSTATFPKDSIPKTTFDPPVETIHLSIPFYEVTTDIDGTDFVNIPDEENAGHLDVVKEPLVPDFRLTASYEPGIRVTDIQMVSRSGESHESGLNLPVSWWNQKIPIGPSDGPSPGTFPHDDFHWTGIERPDGGQDLLLTVHPFFYNATTKDATFYQDYSFHIDFVTSTVNIDAVTPTYRSVPIGSNQDIDVRISNTGAEEVRVNVSMEIQNMGSLEIVSTQDQNGILIPAGGSLVRHFSWDPTGAVQTHYQISVHAFDFVHHGELDAGFSTFRVGVPDLSIESLSLGSATPGFIGNGEVADVRMDIQSVGDIPESGTLTIQIRHVIEGNIVASWENKFSDLIPGATLSYDAPWNSVGILPGEYQLIGWVEHEGGTSPLEVLPFQTKKEMYWDWDSIEDVYLHGNKIVGTANLRHATGGVVGLADVANLSIVRPNLASFAPGLATHAGDPYYSTNFIINAMDPSGLHTLVSDATKEGFQNATGGRWFVVTEDPFSMTATPKVAIADGLTTIHVESDVVGEAGVPVPNGSLMTVNPLIGSVATGDASPTLGGKQVSSVGGRFEFDWRAPTITSLDAFAHCFLGGDRPQSGISAIFKGIDFNRNRRVDAADIGFVRSSEGDRSGTDSFDQRKELNGDDIIDSTDTQEVIDRWGLEFSDAVKCATCTPAPKSYGVKIRPVPDRASIPPGGSLTIDIVAEGLDDMGGYEFGSILTGNALDWMGLPEQNPALNGGGTVQHPLGPIAYDVGGYRLGAWFSGEGPGPSGMATLATFSVTAAQMGEAHLILSAPVIVRMDGTEQAVMQTVEGIYVVANPTNTPTPTFTVTPTETHSQTPTRTSTPQPTPTVTPTLAANYDVWPPPGGDGTIDSRDLLEWIKRIGSGEADERLIFDFARFWRNDARR